MRNASMLLAIVVVLGFVREAGADVSPPVHDFTVDIGRYSFGFVERRDDYWFEGMPKTRTILCLGPLGVRSVPYNATQGLFGFCLILGMLIILPVVL